MSNLVNSLLIVCVLIALALAITDIRKTGAGRRSIIGFLGLSVGVLILNQTIGFPLQNSAMSFGEGYSVEAALVIMLVGIILGVLARYLYYFEEGGFSWIGILRPLVLTPIVLLPLISMLEGGGLETLQLVSLTILAFQNGFFWPQVFNEAKPETQNG